jgi:hypothetical protein
MMLNLGPAWHSPKTIHDWVKQLKIINVCLYMYIYYIGSDDTTTAI